MTQPRFSLKPGLPPPSASHVQSGTLVHNPSPCVAGRQVSPARSRIAVIPAPQPLSRASSNDSRLRRSVPQSPSSSHNGRAVLASETSAAPPLAVVGVDTTNDGKPNFLYIGADRDRDGIPDALQSARRVRSPSPSRKATSGASEREIEITTAQTIETRLKEFFEQQKTKIGDLAKASLAAHIEDFSSRVALAEERWARNLDEERRIRDESLRALRACIEQNQAALLQTAVDEKNLFEMVHRDLDSLKCRHSSVLAELEKTKSDCSYVVGAHSTLQEFVASVLMRFEALRERTEAALADVQEHSNAKACAREVEVNTFLHEDRVCLHGQILEEDEEEDLQEEAVQEELQVRGEAVECCRFSISSAADLTDLSMLRQDLNNVKAGLRASSHGCSTGASISEAGSAAMDKVDDVLGMISSLCDRIGQLEQTWSQALLEFQAERESRERAATAAEERENAAIAAEERLRKFVQEDVGFPDVRPGYSRVRAVVSEIEGFDLTQKRRSSRESTSATRGRRPESSHAVGSDETKSTL